MVFHKAAFWDPNCPFSDDLPAIVNHSNIFHYTDNTVLNYNSTKLKDLRNTLNEDQAKQEQVHT